MSQGNVLYEMANPTGEVAGTTPVKILCIPNSTYGKVCVLATVNGDPATYAVASDGYTKDFAHGCIMFQTALSTVPTKINVQAISDPAWNVLSA